jgi:hypothetical protein
MYINTLAQKTNAQGYPPVYHPPPLGGPLVLGSYMSTMHKKFKKNPENCFQFINAILKKFIENFKLSINQK